MGLTEAPLVSVVIPTYQRRALLMEALGSLLAQTYPYWEAVVVDDGSTDGTREALRDGFADPRIRLIERKGRISGAPVCRNQGAAASQGKYIVFLDSDDLLSPECLERRVAAVEEEPELDCAIFACDRFLRRPGDLKHSVVPLASETVESDLDRFLLRDCPWQILGPIWKKRTLERVGPWREGLSGGQDIEYHVRALVAGIRYKKIQQMDCYWRLEQEDSVGSRFMRSPEWLPNFACLMNSLHQCLLGAELMTNERRQMLAGNYFLFARVWAHRRRNMPTALSVWREALRCGLVARPTHREVERCLRIGAWTAAGGFVERYMRMRWPILYVVGHRDVQWRCLNTYRANIALDGREDGQLAWLHAVRGVRHAPLSSDAWSTLMRVMGRGAGGGGMLRSGA